MFAFSKSSLSWERGRNLQSIWCVLGSKSRFKVLSPDPRPLCLGQLLVKPRGVVLVWLGLHVADGCRVATFAKVFHLYLYVVNVLSIVTFLCERLSPLSVIFMLISQNTWMPILSNKDPLASQATRMPGERESSKFESPIALEGSFYL